MNAAITKRQVIVGIGDVGEEHVIKHAGADQTVLRNTLGSPGKYDICRILKGPPTPNGRDTLNLQLTQTSATTVEGKIIGTVGGSIANLAVSLGRLGQPVIVFTPHRPSTFVDVKGILKQEGVEFLGPEITGVAHTAIIPGANGEDAWVLCYKQPGQVPKRVRRDVTGDILKYRPTTVVATGIRAWLLPLVESVFTPSAQQRVRTVFVPNPSVLGKGANPVTRHLLHSVLRKTSVLCMNETEAARCIEEPLNGGPDHGQLARMLKLTKSDDRKGTAMAEAVIVTGGRKGSWVMFGDEPEKVYHQPAWHVAAGSIQDTTGAGDGYLATFLWGLTSGMLSRQEIMEAAAWVASQAILELGGSTGMPRLPDLLAYIQQMQARNQPPTP